MNNSKSFYITTTLPYVNADAHIGHALEFVRADSVARYKRLQGFNVVFNTGTDEHGSKIYQKAQEKGVDTQVYVDEYAKRFKDLTVLLNISNTSFVRTTDSNHVEGAIVFWNTCLANGDIYKKKYSAKYCVGCEMEKTDSELVNGRCELHQDRELELIEEENYFFKYSKYQDKLLALYEKESFVIPESRLNEIRSFVKGGLHDFSISRLKEKMSWGIPVPNDPEHVMYVWFDALVSYIVAIGWPHDLDKMKSLLPMVQYCGKDNLRPQAGMWQAMLFSAGIQNSETIVVNGFVTGEGGIKMSKSLGNVVDPLEVIKEYGVDALRYYVLRELSPFEDSPFSKERMKESYNAGLANGLGNLVSRVLKMATTYGVVLSETDFEFPSEYTSAFERYNLKEAMDYIWLRIQSADRSIQETQPFKLIKTDPEKAKSIVSDLLTTIFSVAMMLRPFLPETADTILSLLKESKMPEKPLFQRVD